MRARLPPSRRKPRSSLVPRKIAPASSVWCAATDRPYLRCSTSSRSAARTGARDPPDSGPGAEHPLASARGRVPQRAAKGPGGVITSTSKPFACAVSPLALRNASRRRAPGGGRALPSRMREPVGQGFPGVDSSVLPSITFPQPDCGKPNLRSDLDRADGAEDHDGRRPIVLTGQVRLPAARLPVRVTAALLAEENPGAFRLELVVHTPRYRRPRDRRQVAANASGTTITGPVFADVRRPIG